MKKLIHSTVILFVLCCNLFLVSCKKDAALSPVSCFTATKQQVKNNEPVQFSNCSVNAASYEWDFGDGNRSTDASPSKAYTANGIYNVVLTAINADGVKASSQHTITVKDCAQGYEGDNCDVESRAKFLGTYRVVETMDSTGSTRAYTSRIIAVTPNVYTVLIEDYYFSNVDITATIAGDSIHIAEQPFVGEGTVWGSGKITGNVINIRFITDYPRGGVFGSSSTWTKQ